VTLRPLVVGIFVGGRAMRFGGIPKGLLRAPDTNEPLVARLSRLAREAIPGAELVLVGNAEAYRDLDLPSLADEAPGQGPLAGLVALLGECGRRERDAIALAGDLPFITAQLLSRLAREAPDAAALAPRPDGIWQPLFARYASDACGNVAARALDGGARALHRVLDALGDGAAEFRLSDEEAPLLRDWDSPEDVNPRQ
jgi:molybdopterin-guanine dinucleotide biosynthesis protein A